MSFFSIRQAFAALCVAVLVSACGGNGSSAPPPVGGITVKPGDGTATITWTSAPGVKYWLFYAPSATISSTDWINIPGSRAIIDVTSPYVVTGLVNGYTYSFTVNGRNGDGPGGAGSPAVSIVPRPAGETWTVGGSLGTNTLRSMAYGVNSTDSLGYYVAVGDAGSTYRSTDGLTWTALASAANVNLNAVLYTLGKFIAVGASGTITYGSDLATWSAANANSTETLNAIASNGALAVVVGNNGTIRTSTDGIAWTAVASPTTQHLRGVAYAGSGFWTAVGVGGTLLTSANGTTWTAVASGSTADLNAVTVQVSTAYTFVAVGNRGAVVTSSDNGVTWTAQSSGTTADLFAVSPTSAQVLAIGSGGTVLTSPTGTTWTSRNSTTTAHLYAVLNGFAQYVAIGQGGVSINSQ